MANHIVDTLIEEKADIFLSAFRQRSKELFVDDEKANALRHPGEFGTYRENITADFLRCFLPQHLEIDTGFVVNAREGVSKQIDLVVYNPTMTPPLESKRRQRFYPVETVVAAGEVRSDLDKRSLRDGLRRLAAVKELRATLPPEASAIIRWPGLGQTKYDPTSIPFDQVFTFLVCKRFESDYSSSFPSILDEVYAGFDDGLRHSAILSLDDGLLYYSEDQGDGTMLDSYFPTTPIEGKRNLGKWMRPDGNPYGPLKAFTASLFMHACHCTVAYPDLGRYQVSGEHRYWRERPDRGS